MKNVILITIDCLRADHLSCLGYSKKTTPALDNLAKEGVLFSQAISTGTSTPLSFPGILASTYPQYRLGDHRWLPKDKPLISEILKRAGYKTAAFHSNPFLSSYYLYDCGFDVFYDSFIFKHTKMSERIIGQKYETCKIAALKAKFLFSMLTSSGTPYKNAETINQKAIRWLRNNTDNFFLWLHYMDAHPPYLPPKKYLPEHISRSEAKKITKKMIVSREKITDTELKSLIDLYDGGVRYVDQEIGFFFDELKKLELDNESTFVIVTADHGEEFRDHGKIGHGRAQQKPYEELIHVPLIIGGGLLQKGLIIDQVVSLLDISPTILDLLSVPMERGFQGKSLLPVIRGKRMTEGVISESYVLGANNAISYRTPEWKFIMMGETGDKCELYNLRSDPKEKENLYKNEKEIERAKEFELKVKEHIAKPEKIPIGLKRENCEIIKNRVMELKRLGKI